MKIFITGGTGFIGSNLVKRLSQTGHQLYCLARKSSDTRKLEESRVAIIYGDVTDKKSLLEGMAGCDWVAHLASAFEFWVRNKKVFAEVNIAGTRNVMESALETGVKKVVYVSTAAVYGNSEWPVTEEVAPGSVRYSCYAETKYQGDLVAWDLYERNKLPLVAIYPGAVLGPDDPKAAGRYIRNVALGKMPAQVLADTPFPFVHVRDVCEAILLAFEKQNNEGEKYLITKYSLTFGEINRLVSEISGTPLPGLRLPDFLTVLGSLAATCLSKITRRPPILDMSVDQIKLMSKGCRVDGSKAERELGLKYTPIPVAIEEAVASYMTVRKS